MLLSRCALLAAAVLIWLVISTTSEDYYRPHCPRSKCGPQEFQCKTQHIDSCNYLDPEKCPEEDLGYLYYGCNVAGDGEHYVRTLYGAIYVSLHHSARLTWQAAAEDCCLRGGYLATFLNQDFDDLKMKFAANNSLIPPKIWVGAADPAAEGNAVWCLPGGGNVSIKSPLSSVSLSTWNSTNSENENCVAYFSVEKNFKLINCTEELSFMCNIEISFPGGCFDSWYSQNENNIKREAVAFQTKRVSSAINIQEDPGTPFYFKCNAKKYMGIMAEFSRLTAETECKNRGLLLLSVDTLTEMKCILRFFDGTMSTSYWTSGVNYGTNDSFTYGWCSTGKLINKKLWAEGQPMDPEGERCVALTYMEDNPTLSGLEPVHCALLLPLICQFP